MVIVPGTSYAATQAGVVFVQTDAVSGNAVAVYDWAANGTLHAAGEYQTGGLGGRDVATGRQRAVLKGNTDQVMAVTVAPDGNWLATASGDGTARVWATATGHPKTLMRMDGSIAICAWLGSPSLAVGGSARPAAIPLHH